MNNLRCPVCGFETHIDEARNEHFKKMNDNAHRELAKQKAENKAQEIKEGAEDAWESVKDKTRTIV